MGYFNCLTSNFQPSRVHLDMTSSKYQYYMQYETKYQYYYVTVFLQVQKFVAR